MAHQQAQHSVMAQIGVALPLAAAADADAAATATATAAAAAAAAAATVAVAAARAPLCRRRGGAGTRFGTRAGNFEPCAARKVRAQGGCKKCTA